MNTKSIAYAVHRALFKHCRGSLTGLFARLEYKSYRTGKFVLHLFQNLYRAQQHGVVGVMTASVHNTVVYAGKIQVCLFLNVQSVDVAANHNYFVALALRALELGDNARRLCSPIRNTELIQLFADSVCCAELFHRRFRVFVDVSSVINSFFTD